MVFCINLEFWFPHFEGGIFVVNANEQDRFLVIFNNLVDLIAVDFILLSAVSIFLDSELTRIMFEIDPDRERCNGFNWCLVVVILITFGADRC